MRRTLTILAVAVLTTLSLLAPTASASPPSQVDVIVVLHDGFAPTAVAGDHGVELHFVYEHALNGFAGAVPEGRMNGLMNDRRVDYVELDQVVSIAAQTTPTGVQRIFADDNAAIGINGVDDQRVDATVAVIDTGIDYEHPDLNVVAGVDCFYSNSKGHPAMRNYYCDAGGDDDHYHGTHVAGTIGALDNDFGVVGVAPGVALVPVKVLNSSGSGYTSNVIAGIDWVAENATWIDVANMSLGGGFSQAENDAVNNAVAAGVVFVVAAGNSDANASNYSPASAADALTVSALADFDGAPGALGSPTCRTDEDDTLANFSNWGDAVDIAAPGVCILSTYPLERGSYDTISGTSMASPHVAGAAALLASSGLGTAQIRSTLLTSGGTDWTDDSGDLTKEPLLNVSTFTPTLVDSGGGASEPPPGPDPGPDPSGGAAVVQSESYSQFGGKSNDNHLDVTIRVVDADGAPAVGLAVTIDLYNGTARVYSGATGVTDSAGYVTFGFRKTGAGCFAADVTAVSGTGWSWDGNEPATTSCT